MLPGELAPTREKNAQKRKIKKKKAKRKNNKKKSPERKKQKYSHIRRLIDHPISIGPEVTALLRDHRNTAHICIRSSSLPSSSYVLV